MSKESIRKKIEEAKKSAERVLGDKKTSKESVLVIQSLLMILEIVVAVLLEKKVRKNSSNSGLPPSQDTSSKPSRQRKGKKPNDNKKRKRLPNSKTTVETKVLAQERCSGCDADLENAEIVKTDTRKLIDIRYEVVETEYIAETRICENCGEKNKPEFPEGIDGKSQYGVGIKATVIDLLMFQMVSLQRTQEHFMGLVGYLISQSLMLKWLGQFGESLKDWTEKAKKKLLESGVIYVDETSIRVNGKILWVHTYSAGKVVLQFVHPSRGIEAMEAIGILPKYGGIIVHDCWASYFMFGNLKHALCIAHLLRELNFVIEATGHEWAKRMKKLLKEAVKNVAESPQKILTEKAFGKLVSNYQGILFEALLEMPSFPESEGRGRPKQTDEQNLWMRLMDYESSVLMFTKVGEVDATNNRAERDLRVNKLKKKVSGCFRTLKNAEYFCRILSFLKTMRYKGHSSLEAISMAMNGENIDP